MNIWEKESGRIQEQSHYAMEKVFHLQNDFEEYLLRNLSGKLFYWTEKRKMRMGQIVLSQI